MRAAPSGVACPTCDGPCQVHIGEDLQAQLIRHRQQRGWSRLDVALQAGISLKRVQEVELGDPYMSTVRRYAHAIGVLVNHHLKESNG